MFIFSSCLNASNFGQVNIRMKELCKCLENKIPFLVSNKFVAYTNRLISLTVL